MKPRALVPVTLSAALLITACSSPDSATPEAPESSAGETQPAADGAVSLTHPSIEGLEIAFDAQPQTLVMDCYAYSSFSDYDLQPAALFGFDCENPNVMGDADISGIEFVGKDGEINMEKLAELRPDAIIGNGGAEGWSWFDEDVNGQLLRVAPFVPLPSGEPSMRTSPIPAPLPSSLVATPNPRRSRLPTRSSRRRRRRSAPQRKERT